MIRALLFLIVSLLLLPDSSRASVGDENMEYYFPTPTQDQIKNCPEEKLALIWNGLTHKYECIDSRMSLQKYYDQQKKECEKDHGEWQEGYNILPHCLSQWSATEKRLCKTDGWVWKWNGYNFSCFEIKEAQKCHAQKGEWGIFNGSDKVRCRLPEDRKKVEDCEKQGGEWRPEGMARKPSCRITYKDANKPCYHDTDCLSKKCLADRTTKEHGVCHGNNSPFGCFEYFGESRRIICVD